MTWLVSVMLAQALGYWVEFEICRVDRAALPHVARRLDPPEIMSLWITNERKPGLLDIAPRPQGLSCDLCHRHARRDQAQARRAHTPARAAPLISIAPEWLQRLT